MSLRPPNPGQLSRSCRGHERASSLPVNERYSLPIPVVRRVVLERPESIPGGPSAHPDRRNRLPDHKPAILALQQERYHRAAVIPDHVTDAPPPIASARTKRNLARHLPLRRAPPVVRGQCIEQHRGGAYVPLPRVICCSRSLGRCTRRPCPSDSLSGQRAGLPHGLCARRRPRICRFHSSPALRTSPDGCGL